MEREEKQLYEAARNDDFAKVKTLIVSGADISFFDSDGLTLLMHAAELNHIDVVKALLDASIPWNPLYVKPATFT